MSLNIALIEPEIPQNTGNIARTCAATGSVLHLVKPLGFSIDDRYLKRAGLDYWSLLDIRIYENRDEFFEKNKNAKMFFSTTKAIRSYCEAEYEDGCFLVFGKETKGIDESILINNLESTIKIPMIDEARSLNLSNSVAIVAYEALRQLGFPGLKAYGKFSEKQN